MMAAELVFIGQIAPERTAGADVATQARSALSRLTVALAERGLGLEDLLRLRLFVGDLGDLPAIERAIDSSGPTEWPAVSVIELPADSTPKVPLGVAVTLDAVAAPGAREQRRVVPPEPGGRGARAGLRGPPRSVRLGPWVFVGATTASAGEARSSSPSGRPDGADSAARRIIGEGSRAVFARIEKLLRAQGAEPRDVVSVGGWLTFPVRRSDYRPLGDVREALLAETGLFPASAAVRVGRVRTDDCLLAFEAIAFAPEDQAERERWRAASLPPPSLLAPYYASARSAGGYVFTCGEVPVNTRAPDPDRPVAVETQAEEVYTSLRSHLAAHGAGPADVVHQTVFVRHPCDQDAVADAARKFYGADTLPPPPTTLLSVADIGFHSGCDVEVELVAAADGSSADAR
ncbi:MAG TPA: Rid family hydrolase [Solirubrobacteraceae bacterium]|jgi:enamine deaminase RidA (YjgF/YER057c/UK114 family)|nr:Rid family hydrolase [Solirubrobacteraceae bacterium]